MESNELSTHRIFISYKSEQVDIAKKIYENIENWGHLPWLDKYEIPVGTTDKFKGWDDAIHDGMKSCNIILGLMSNVSLASPNVLDEWGWTIDTQRRLLLLQIDDINPDDIPPRYIRIQRINCQNDFQHGLSILKATLGTSSLVIPKIIPTEPPSSQSDVQHTLMNTTNQSTDTNREVKQSVPLDKPKSEFTSKKYTTTDDVTSQDIMKNLLQNLHKSWIEGVLEASLISHDSVDLSLTMQPNAVLRHSNFGDLMLPFSSSLAEVFEEMDYELLILGDPGAGKTTTLLQLCRDIFNRFRIGDSDRAPVVFNLSGWSGYKEVFFPRLVEEIKRFGLSNIPRLISRIQSDNLLQPAISKQPISFEDWLFEELVNRYDVPKSISIEWLYKNRLIIMLDGLDEVVEENKDSVISEINRFRSKYVGVGIVVCSRSIEYAQLTNKLGLNYALQLEPLTDEQIKIVLDDSAYESALRLIENNDEFKELIRTPFVLTLVCATYFNESIFFRDGNLLNHIMEDYIQLKIKQSSSIRYNTEETYKFLTWLAYVMKSKSMIIYYADEIGVSWLPRDSQSWFLKTISQESTGDDLTDSNKNDNQGVMKFIRNKFALKSPALAGITTALGIAIIGGGIIPIIGVGIFARMGVLQIRSLAIKRLHNVLAKNQLFTSNQLDFLDHCVSLKLMRKVGTGYIFIHRTILEHFADVAPQYHEKIEADYATSDNLDE